MRILYILTSLGIGGAEKQVVTLAERMAAKGHSVALIALKHSNVEWPVKLPVLRLNMRKTPIGILRGVRFTTKFVELFRPDILHSHTFPANIFARLLKPLLRVPGGLPLVLPPLINTIHNVYEGGWHRMLIYRMTDAMADAVTAVSAAAADRFVQLRAVPAGKVHVLTNGIDTEAFTPDRARRRRIRAQMKSEREFVWLAVGRLAPAKDYPNLLRAFAQLQSAISHVSLWIAGEGDPSPLQTGNSESRDDSRVQLLGLRHDVVDLLDAADAFVLSSAWEGMPLALGEAMAMEKPVVATDVGGVRELIGAAGFVVAPKDSNALCTAMSQVMGLKERERRAIGMDARERIELHFSMGAKAGEWEQLYAQLLNGKKA